MQVTHGAQDLATTYAKTHKDEMKNTSSAGVVHPPKLLDTPIKLLLAGIAILIAIMIAAKATGDRTLHEASSQKSAQR